MTARLQPERAQVVMGQPILVSLVVENCSREEMIVYLASIGGREFSVYIQAEGGPVTAGKLEGPPKEFITGSWAHLGPGEELGRTMVLNEWADFLEPGNYQVVISVPVSSESVGDDMELRASTSIRVLSPDIEVLKSVCEELAADAARVSSVTGRDSARALAQVKDGVCIPSLGLVLNEAYIPLKHFALEGLARIGSPEAIQVVVDSWDQLSRESRARALNEFERRGQREALLEALKAACLTLEIEGESV